MICPGSPVDFSISGMVNQGTQPAFAWLVNSTLVSTNSSFSSSSLNNNDVVTCQLTSSLECVSNNPVSSEPFTANIGPNLPVSVSLSASANPVSAGTQVTFTATPTNGGVTPSYEWHVNGMMIPDATSSTYSFIPANNDMVVCIMTSNATCTTGNPSTSNTITMNVLPAISLSFEVTPDCTYGMIAVVASGGTAPYYYDWSNGATTSTLTNLLGGLYTVSVTDALSWTVSSSTSLTTLNCDFGDAQEPDYRTYHWRDGARHVISGLKLGLFIDSETDGQPTADATGDDTNGAIPDDEDGIVDLNGSPFNYVHPGYNMVMFSSYNTLNETAFLQGWLDFGNDGWGSAYDQIITSYPMSPVMSMSSGHAVFFVPQLPAPANTIARFRLSTTNNLTYTGLAPDGEVEDYFVFVDNTDMFTLDYGDAPDVYHTYNTNSGPRHFSDCHVRLGARIDAEDNGQPTPNSNGDDFNGGPSDEDGVVFPVSFSSTNNQITIEPYNYLSNSEVYVNGWFDFNKDGVFDNSVGSVEHVVNNFPVPYMLTSCCNQLGVPANLLSFTIAIPSGAGGDTYSRFRISDTEYLGPTDPPGSQITIGEIEDYLVFINNPVTTDTLWMCKGMALPIMPPPVMGGSAPYTYQWSSNPQGFNSGSQNPVVSPLQSTKYMLTVTDAGGQVMLITEHVIIIDSCDYGDAPDDLVTYFFPTKKNLNGAAHLRVLGKHLGTILDPEPDGVQSTMATGDDFNKPSNDEDGITQYGSKIFALIQGNNYLDVTASVAGYINAWVDLDNSHSWNNTNERIWTNLPVTTTGTYNLPMPGTFSGLTYARFRFTDFPVSNPTPDGVLKNGEVEDYWVRIDRADVIESDIWMADTPNDDGTEQNTDTGPMYVSQDILVRNQNDGVLVHQEPLYRSNCNLANSNWVYVTVRNRGNGWTNGEELKVYWSMAAVGSIWPNDWMNNGIYGNEITNDGLMNPSPIIIPSIPPGQSILVRVPWCPPNPANYSGVDPYHICLLARITGNNIAPYGDDIRFIETSNIWHNVSDNNNIIWRNTYLKVHPFQAGLFIKNPGSTLPMKLLFNAPPAGGNENLFQYGQVMVDLGAELHQAWVAGGSQGEGFYAGAGNLIILNTSQSWIGNILAFPSQITSMNFQYVLLSQPPVSSTNLFGFDIIQALQMADSDSLLVGQRIFFKTSCPDPVIHEYASVCGSSALLTAVDLNNVTVQYQWQLNGFNIAGATNDSLDINKIDDLYSVVLTDGKGCSNIASRHVTANPPLLAPFVENLESVTFPPACWTNTAVSGPSVWARSTSASGNGIGTGSALANFYDQASGIYELKTMPFDISGLTAPVVKFDHAYATYSGENDQMDVYYSTNLGSTWSMLLNMPGGTGGILNTAGTSIAEFIPTASQWATRTIPLPPGTDMLKFKAISAYGNNLYLDNITVLNDVPAVPVNNIVQNVTVTGNTCFNATNTITVAGGGTNYTITGSGSATFIAGQKISFLSGTTVQTGGQLHAYIASGGPWCGEKSSSIVTVPEGAAALEPFGDKSFFTLYPNPTTGAFFLEPKDIGETAQLSVEIYGIHGDRVLATTLKGNRKYSLSLDGKPNGIYLLRVISGNHAGTGKVIKQ